MPESRAVRVDTMTWVLVRGRGDAVLEPARADGVVISIRDPGKDKAALEPGWRDVLHLAFHDKEDDEVIVRTGLYRLFDAALARQCWEFVERHRQSASMLMVHCNAGASRSPSVARAIAEHYGFSFEHDRAQGNELVYRTMQATRPTNPAAGNP